MRTIGIVAALVSVSAAAAQGVNPSYDKVLKIDCEKGNPWRMPVPSTVGEKEMETPIKLYAVDGKSVLICNCTADRAGGSCGTAGSSTVALKPGDKSVETWGTFEAFEAK